MKTLIWPMRNVKSSAHSQMTLKTCKQWSGYTATIQAPYANVKNWCVHQWGVDPDMWYVYNYSHICEIWMATETHLSEFVLAWS